MAKKKAAVPAVPVVLSTQFSGKSRSILQIVERMGLNANTTSTVIINATGADPALVGDVRRLVRQATGMHANLPNPPASQNSRGMPRRLLQALEAWAANPNATAAQVSNATGLPANIASYLRTQIARVRQTIV